MSSPENNPDAPLNPERPVISVPEWAVPRNEALAPATPPINIVSADAGEMSAIPVGTPSQPADPDLRVAWGWVDVLLFGMFYLGSTVVVLVAIMIGLTATSHRGLMSLANDDLVKANVAIIAQTLGSVLAMLYFWVMVRLRNAGPFWSAMGWRPLGTTYPQRHWLIAIHLGYGLAIAVVVSLLSKFVPQKETLPIEQLFQSRETVIVLMIFGILVAPLIEETIFRGFLYPVVARSFGVVAGILMTGILFGLIHSFQLWGGWGQIALLIGVGVIMTWVRVARRTVLASYLLHVAYNTTLFAGFFIATGGLRHLPAGS
jgi:hypothetical protein